MTRPMCKLCGVEYPQPVTLDEVPIVSSNVGSGREYFYVSTYHGEWSVSSAHDSSRSSTRSCVEGGVTHWSEEDAEKHMAALRAVIAHATSRAA